MKIIITGSLGNIGKPLTEILVKAGHQITVISSRADRKQAIESLGAKATIGSVSDPVFLSETFKDADAVFLMTPPNLGGSNVISNTTNAGKAYVQAIRNNNIKHVVMLSSIGADLAGGNGPIAGLYNIEQLYNQLESPAFTYLRAGYFYTNLYNDIPVIKGMGILGGNYPADTAIPLVHPVDIAKAAAEALQSNAEGKSIRYVVSDIRKARELAGVLGAAIGKPELSWLEFSDEQTMQGMIQAGVPQEIAGLYTEMGAGFREEEIPRHFRQIGSPVGGAYKLEDFAKDFAQRFEAAKA